MVCIYVIETLHLSFISYTFVKIYLNTIMKEGKVKFFNESKGYGFIKDNETSEEHFVHVSGLIDRITEGDEVTFELQQGKKGLNAVNVKKVG